MTIIVKEHEFFRELEEALMHEEQAVYSARIVEETDGTFDLRIWDERLGESCEDIEDGHFISFENASLRLNQIIEDNPGILFIKVESKT